MKRSRAGSSAGKPAGSRRPFGALVTGARGFVGRRLVRRLRAEGARVVEWDARAGLDLCDWDAVRTRRLPRGLDAAFHLAAVSYVPAAWADPQAMLRTNLDSTLHVLEVCRRRGIPRLVFVSSCIYGPPRYLPIDEKHPVAPANPYAWSKHLGEQLCRTYAHLYGLRVVIVRPFNIYGPGQDPRFLVPAILDQVRRGGTVTLDSLTPRRDLLYVDDLVEALFRAARFEGPGVEVFNLGAGVSHSVREIAEAAGRAAGKVLRLASRRRSRRGEVRDVVADVRKARRRLGWRPVTSLEEGLAQTWAAGAAADREDSDP